MIPTTTKYKRQLIAGNRNYVVKVEMTLTDETTLTLTNENLWEQGVKIDNAISSDSSFDIGAAIIGSLQLVIDNITGAYNAYDFIGASLWLYMGVTGDTDNNNTQVYYRINQYVVDEASYNGSLITLDCLDNMTWFDIPFNKVLGVSYPTTAGYLVSAICSACGVQLAKANFPNYTTPIPVAPDKENTNCREVLQYIAQKCCCYCKITTTGQLLLAWYDKTQITGLTDYDGGTYDTDTTPYSDGDEVEGGRWYTENGVLIWTDTEQYDGGTFTSANANAFLTQNYQMDVSTDDIVVTGCRVVSTVGENTYDTMWVDTELERTHERYLLVIENNPFIVPEDADTTATNIGSIIAGLPIRAYTATSLNDLSYETGDMVTIYDFRGNIYRSWITSLTFTINNSEQFACAAQSVHERSQTRFSDSAKTLAEATANAGKILTDYDNAVKAMNELAQQAIGYNIYQYEVGGSNITWLFNGAEKTGTDAEPLFPNSSVVFKISGDGVFISNDGGVTYTQGYDANSGTAILSLIYAVGINCDWIHAGTLTLGGTDNVNGVCSVLDENGDEKVRLDENGITATKGVFSGRLEAATGTISDGIGTLYLANGDLKIMNRLSGGAGVFAYRTGTAYESCWGSVRSSARKHNNAGGFIDALTFDVVTAGANESDRRLKQDIKEIDSDFAERLIFGISPVEFRYKKDTETLRFGVIAQDVQAIEKEFGLDRTENRLCYEMEDSGMLAVEYRQFIAPMIKVIQNQQSEIDLLKQEIAELKARAM